MLRVVGRTFRHCDGVTRRDFLTIGALGFGGLTLADLLRLEATAGIGSSRKAVINIHLDGGPSQLDTIDPKPDAPSEIRGPFAAIATRLPGVQISELLPKLAARADRLVLVRSLIGSAGAHDAFQCQSGYRKRDLESLGGRPALGCVVSKLLSTPRDPVPAFVDLLQGRALVRNSARPGFLGPSYQPFRPDISHLFERQLEPGMKNELKRLGGEHSIRLKLDAQLSAGRLDSRQSLLASLDRVRRQVDSSGMMDAMDRFHQQAIGILTSGALADALDFEKEDPRMLDRYTAPQSDRGKKFYTAEGPAAARKFLLARRLIEAGVRCVSVSISDFDTHSDNFPRMRHLLPTLDHGLSVLLDDLSDRGMLDDVTVVAWGEFGRTPRIDAKTGGRHHWPQVSPAILAGGGISAGQVIGATDREAGAPTSRPVHYKDIIATLYRNLGLDARRLTITDPQGRPQFLLDDGEPLREL